MSAEPTSCEPASEPGLSPRTQRHLAILERLAQQGADIATRLHEQAVTATEPGVILAKLGGQFSVPIITQDMVAAFDQIARAVRRTILLAERLAEPPAPVIPRAQPREAARDPMTPERQETIRLPRRNPPSLPDLNEPELVQPEYQDRVDPLDPEDELGPRSTREILARIRQDLDAGNKQLARRPDRQAAEHGGPRSALQAHQSQAQPRQPTSPEPAGTRPAESPAPPLRPVPASGSE